MDATQGRTWPQRLALTPPTATSALGEKQAPAPPSQGHSSRCCPVPAGVRRTLIHGTWSSCRHSGVVLRSCDLSDLELDSCRLDGADLRGSRLNALATPLDNLQGVTLTDGQLPELTRMAIDALSIDVHAGGARGR